MSSRTPESELQQLLEGSQDSDWRSEDTHAESSPRETSPAQVLAGLGGLASSHAIAEGLDPTPTLREVRDRLKDWDGIRKLGGGFFALRDHPAPPLGDWLSRWLGARRHPEDDVLDAIQAAWPHGHRPSIRAWMHQDPGPVRVGQGEVWIFHSRRRSR